MHTRVLLLIACLLFVESSTSAEVHLPCLFTDHMVLQESGSVPVWGTASPGEHVTVTLAGQSAETSAGADGNWLLKLNLHGFAGGPYRLTIAGEKTITLFDVLVGEVWLAGGQSNMEFELAKSEGADAEIANSTNTNLRQFKVAKAGSFEPADTCSGHWVSAAPSTSGDFTAIGYYFAKQLQKDLQKPVALVSSYYGGSNVESWLSPDAMEKLPEIKAVAETMITDGKSYTQRLAQYRQDYQAWQQKVHRDDVPEADRAKLADPALSTSMWRSVNVGSGFTENALPNGGVVWLRKQVKVTPEMAGIYLPMHFGAMHEFDDVYWNGVRIGGTSADASTSMNDSPRSGLTRRYDVPARFMQAGEGTLAIRIFNPVAPPSIDNVPRNEAALQGDWNVKIESTLPAIDPTAKAAFPQRPAVPSNERSEPTALYNSMIHPIIPFAIHGVIWMQGEANIGRAFQYRTIFPAMIRDWRTHWGEGDFPFYFCQLANWQEKVSAPGDSNLAELREAQSMALALPNTGEVITIDVGEAGDVHFRDKKTVGLRMARIAMAKDYGHPMSYSGPVYASSERNGSAMRIHFKFADGGLVAAPIPATYKEKSTYTTSLPLVRNSPKSELEGFQICGTDHRWVWANAKIKDDTILVSSPQIKDPVAVRYGWANNPTVNLYNGAGLPADPFRTDDFPAATRDAKF
ncbi:MAG TPA: sialate O-acetylesterase [Terracidiphilus sp.]|jgi:sialate O-acetylesterase|nr:sialate O-acetylesterase [Terracidiphilus sp.]